MKRRYLRRQVAASAIKQQWREVVLALSQRVLIPVPLARDLSHLSVLAPPYGDDVWASFPEAHIRESFHFFLTATDDDRRRVTQAVGERAETIGYPQYWAAQAIGHPDVELRRHLNLNGSDRVIAWLPGSLNDLPAQIDYLQALTGTFTVVLRPHPDLYLPEREARRHEVYTHARAQGMLVQDSHRMDAGLLVRGADLVIAEGASSLRSSLFLGAQVVIGLNQMKSKHRRWAAETNLSLFDLFSLYRREIPSDRLVTLLSEVSWWEDMVTASQSVRNTLFRGVPAADVGRHRCAAALNCFALRSGL